MPNLRRDGGFTLIELTAVVAVAGVLSAAALPRLVDISREARTVKIEMARGAVLESARDLHIKWMLAGAPAAARIIDGVPMNAAGFPTAGGILDAAGVEAGYDTHRAGIVATDAGHPDCSLAYRADSGSVDMRYANGANC